MREVCAIASNSWLDFRSIKRSNRRTSSDFLSAKLSRVSTNDIINNFVRVPVFANVQSHRSMNSFEHVFDENITTVYKTNGGIRDIRTPPSQCDGSILEGEINAAAHHTEVVVWTVDKVPAEIINPADVRREANFEAAADLADSLGSRICMTSCHDLVEAFP